MAGRCTASAACSVPLPVAPLWSAAAIRCRRTVSLRCSPLAMRLRCSSPRLLSLRWSVLLNLASCWRRALRPAPWLGARRCFGRVGGVARPVGRGGSPPSPPASPAAPAPPAPVAPVGALCGILSGGAGGSLWALLPPVAVVAAGAAPCRAAPGCWRLRSRCAPSGPCRAGCAPAAPVAPVVWWRRFAPSPSALRA